MSSVEAIVAAESDSQVDQQSDSQSLAFVDSLEDVFQWPEYVLSKLSKQDLMQMKHRLSSGMSLSTCFSGIYAPSCAFTMIMLIFSQLFLPGGAPSFVTSLSSAVAASAFDYVACCTWDTECLYEQQSLGHVPSNVFCNVLDFATKTTKNKHEDMLALNDVSWTKLRTLILAPGAVTTKAYCVKSRCVKEHP